MPQTSSALSRELARLIVRELDGCIRELQLFPDDEAVWRVVPGVTNSAGNLVRHLCGNLNHFIGACLCGTGFVRDRQAEFAARAGSRDSLIAELRSTIVMLESTLVPLGDERLDAPMPGAPNGLRTSVRFFLVHLVAHTAFHLGQLGYLRRILHGEHASSADPLPLTALAD